MAEFKKYLMKNQNDYRPDVDNHEIILIKTSTQGDWAYGRFSIVDEDMIDLTEKEKLELPKRDIPKISLRQCRELLILTNRFDDVENILASLPESTDEEKATKRILTNYWEYSTDFERDHKYMSLITNALGMSEDEVDDFFITAYAL